MPRKTTPEKLPTNKTASIAGHAMATGKATPAQTRTMGARIESERAATVRKTPKR